MDEEILPEPEESLEDKLYKNKWINRFTAGVVAILVLAVMAIIAALAYVFILTILGWV